METLIASARLFLSTVEVRKPCTASRPSVIAFAARIRCGRCGRKLHVHDSGKQGVGLYRCRAASATYADPVCLGFRGTGLERAVEEEVLKVLEPGAIEAALVAGRAVAAGKDEHLRPVELELEQARYETERSFRQYHASDPENRTNRPGKYSSKASPPPRQLGRRSNPLFVPSVAVTWRR